MANTRSNQLRKGRTQPVKAVVARAGKPHSLAIAQKGVRTAPDFAALMSALMSDAIEGKLSPPIVNATCNAGGKLLKVVEMQYRQSRSNQKRPLVLAGAA